MIATIPFDHLFQQIAINTSIIKSIKIIKLNKLLKILKLSKVFSQRSNAVRFALGQEIVSIMSGLSGFFNLILQNLFIIIGSH